MYGFVTVSLLKSKPIVPLCWRSVSIATLILLLILLAKLFHEKMFPHPLQVDLECTTEHHASTQGFSGA